MANKQNNGQPGDRLREQAEKVARQAIELAPEDSTSEETKLLLRELRIYQIELEMQNDELRETQIIVERSESAISSRMTRLLSGISR